MIVVGDLNCAPTAWDVTNPQIMSVYAGFTPKERENFGTMLKTTEYIDAWRNKHPNTKQYSWFGKANKMRLDHQLISPTLRDSVVRVEILDTQPPLSDHHPVTIMIKK